MASQESTAPSCHFLGRYVITETIASGGMASIHLGRLVGAEGFVRTVAIKRLLPKLAKKGGDYATMFLDDLRSAMEQLQKIPPPAPKGPAPSFSH